MELMEATGALAALAQPSRLAVFRLLVSSGPLCAGDLAVELALPKPTLSFHLKELTRAGLIGAERDGRVWMSSANETTTRARFTETAPDDRSSLWRYNKINLSLRISPRCSPTA